MREPDERAVRRRAPGRRRVQPLLTALAVAAAGYLLLLALVYVFQPRLLFFPDRRLHATPADAGLGYEELRLRAADGVRLQAWWIPAQPPARAAVVLLHGNGGNLSYDLHTPRLLHELGYGVLALGYRGYGASEGRPHEVGLYADADAAWRHLVEQRGVPPQRVVVLGRSLGGAVAAALAERRPVGALVLESTFASAPALAAELYPFLPARRLSRYRFDTLARLPRIQAPVLVVHSRDDEIVPFRHGRALYAAARPPKRFLGIRGSHNDGFVVSAAGYREALGAFLREHVQ